MSGGNSRKIIVFSMLGFAAVLVATRLGDMAHGPRTGLMLAGGWLMAVGILYQVKTCAETKDVTYYVQMVYAGVLLVGMVILTLIAFNS